jgi:FkbM family methyltransferase
VFPERIALLARAYAARRLEYTYTVRTPRGPLLLACPSWSAAKRALRYLDSERDTLAWIERCVRAGDCLWDIGANIGAYSLYAALEPGVRVVAFEPSASTFAILSRNINLNGMGEQVQAFCVGLSDRIGQATLSMNNYDAGTAMHAFSQGAAPAPQAAHQQNLLTYSADDFVETFKVPPPDHIKLDVDGPEFEVLLGARECLSGVKSISVEIGRADERFTHFSEYLAQFGLAPARPRQADRNSVFERA